MKETLKKFLLQHSRFSKIVTRILNIVLFNKIISSRKENNFQINGLLKKTKIHVIGKGNKIIIDEYARLIKCKISISGNNNIIHIKRQAYMEYGEICIEDSNGNIVIGNNTIISSNCHLAAIEGTHIDIGANCLFSAFVTLRTGDSHTIFNLEDGNRINHSEDIIIEDHVWVGNGATILKGVHISKNCVIGTNAVVTRNISSESVVAGNPAKLIRKNINWSAIRNEGK